MSRITLLIVHKWCLLYLTIIIHIIFQIWYIFLKSKFIVHLLTQSNIITYWLRTDTDITRIIYT
jgi:hypothetical protein